VSNVAGLTRSAARLAAILDHLPDALLLVDGTGAVVNANARALAVFEVPDTQLVGTRLLDLIPGFGHGRRPAHGGRRVRAEGPIVERFTARRLDGSEVPIELTSTVLTWGAGDEVLLLLVRVRHDSDGAGTPSHQPAQGQLTAVLRATTDAICGVDADGRVVRSDQQDRELRGPLAGDLRRGLAAMRDSLRRVLTRAGGTLSPEVREVLERAAARAGQMLEKVAEAAARDGATETDQPPVQRAEIGQLVERAVAMTTATAAQAGVAVAVMPAALSLDVDAERIVAALSALLAGAVRSSPRGSTVAISASRRGDRVRVVVRDARPTTRGSAGQQSRPTVDPLTPAPGIDVPFVQATAERHGGRFSIEAAPGGGTTYAVELPVAVDPDEEEDGQVTAVAPTRDVAVAPTLALAPVVASPARPRALPARFDVPAAPQPSTQGVLVWPHVHEATTRALSRRGCESVTVRMPQEVAERRQHAAALLVDPLTGPVSRASLTRVRAAAASAGLPLLVAAGLGEVSSDAVHASDPAALIGALRLPGASASLVLLVEPDPVLAEAMGATLERRGMRALLSLSEAEARLRAALAPPDLVLLDLGLMPSPRPGILDWLRSQGRLAKTPVVAYTAAGLRPDHQTRLRRGETVLFVEARPEGKDVDERLAELVLQLAGTPEPL